MTHEAIREATDADWAQIYPFFSAIVDAGETYTYPEGMSSSEARVAWMPSGPDEHTAVLEESGTVLGSARMGPNKPGRGAHIGTASFMVGDAARGRGVGRRLGEYAVQWHRDRGYRGIQFNAVVETNTGAVKLWQSLGFEIVGTVPGAFESPAHGFVGLHVMFLDLT